MFTKLLRKLSKRIKNRNGHCNGDSGGGHCS